MMSDSLILLGHRILDLNRNSIRILFKKFVCALNSVFIAKNEKETKNENIKKTKMEIAIMDNYIITFI